MARPPPDSTLFPYTTLFRSVNDRRAFFSWQPGEDGIRSWHFVEESASRPIPPAWLKAGDISLLRSEEHTSELQSRQYLVCRLLPEKKKKIQADHAPHQTATH